MADASFLCEPTKSSPYPRVIEWLVSPMLGCASWTLSSLKLISGPLEFESCLENGDLAPHLGHVSNFRSPIGVWDQTPKSVILSY